MRPAIDIVDSTWIGAPAVEVARALRDPANWLRWWPGLRLRVDEARGVKGMRWYVDEVIGRGRAGVGAASALRGTAEVWLEHAPGGVVAHFFLRLDPGSGPAIPPRVRRRIVATYRTRTKAALWALGDTLDPGRRVRHVAAFPDVAD